MASQQDMLKLLCTGTSIPFKNSNTKKLCKSGTLKQNPEILSSNGMTNLRKKHKIRVKGFDIPDPQETFSAMKITYPKILKSVLERIAKNGIMAPTPIQMQCVPLLMNQRSVLSCAPTGSGKTLCFVAPILSHLKKSEKGSFRALVISPTRELAQQTFREFKVIGGSRKFTYHLLTKAASKSDVLTTETGNKDILISTPAYLKYMLKEGKLDLTNLQFCVLDEADRLFDVQFKDDIMFILEHIDLVKVTTGLFSATLANGIDDWCFTNLDNFVQVYIGAVNSANMNIDQTLKFVGTEDSKLYSMKMIIKEGVEPPMLIFTQTKDRARQVFEELRLITQKVDVMHSDLSQEKREGVMQSFRAGKTWILICTDLMSRGIDFKDVSCVVNFDLPQTKVDYIHRIGRTGRAGRKGKAITFFTDADKERLPSIINVLKSSGCELPEWLRNIKGLSHRDYKKATRKPVERKNVSTIPSYDIQKAKKRKAMIADSKAKKQKTG